MKVLVVTDSMADKSYEALEITIDDTYKFAVHNNADEPEGNTLSENFSDCYDIVEMLEKAYNAGKNGEEFELDILDYAKVLDKY